MKKYLYIFVLLAQIIFLTGCNDGSRKYVIGVSQCSEDSWRTKLKLELEQATYFNEDVRLVMRSADDNIEQQKQQIKELVDMKVDLLIVSPQQTGNLSDAISLAREKGIPVILFDRKSGASNYTAFMGADNYLIGQMLGEYAADQMGGHGNIVEIAGEHGSSPAIDRHNGFNDAISKYPDIHIIGYAEGDWKQPSGEYGMNKILNELYGVNTLPASDGRTVESENTQKNTVNPDSQPRIDCVFGGNDRMAVGARLALEKYVQCHPNSNIINPSSILYLGVDALPTPGGGIEKVRDGVITVSAIYPTHGDEVMALALNILKGNPYDKETMMETSMVTSANARVLLLQHKEIENQSEYIKRMHNRVNGVVGQLTMQRTVLFCVILVTLLLACFTVLTVRASRIRRRLNHELRKKNEELNAEKENVERQRDELEEQRDQLLDVTHANTELKEDSPEESVSDNSFMNKFIDVVQERLSDSDLSVEDIGNEMCLSRVQLYRRVKAAAGKTPVEIIREERLRRAKILLSDSSLSIAEVAYKVGFSAPSYFTKCYKDFYGKAPSEKD